MKHLIMAEAVTTRQRQFSAPRSKPKGLRQWRQRRVGLATLCPASGGPSGFPLLIISGACRQQPHRIDLPEVPSQGGAVLESVQLVVVSFAPSGPATDVDDYLKRCLRPIGCCGWAASTASNRRRFSRM